MKVKIIALSAILLGGLIAANEYQSTSTKAPTATDSAVSEAQDSKDTKQAQATQFEEGKHYSVIDVAKAKPILDELGVKADESFEIFSYSCPHCLMLEPVVMRLELETGAKVKKFQLGFENFPLAETDYYLKNALKGENLELARGELYKMVQTDGMTFEKINEALEVFPIGQAISEEELADMKPRAEEYAKLTRQLAVALDIQGTPTLFMNGKYQVNMQNVGSVDDLIALQMHLSTLD